MAFVCRDLVHTDCKNYLNTDWYIGMIRPINQLIFAYLQVQLL
jgi:hypothetical protein